MRLHRFKIGIFALGVALSASVRAEDCTELLDRSLSDQLKNANQGEVVSLKLNDAIGFSIARDYWLLNHHFRVSSRFLRNLSEGEREQCAQFAVRVLPNLRSFFVQRLNSLLEQNDLVRFYAEAKMLLEVMTSKTQRQEMARFLEPFEKKYLEANDRSLNTQLRETSRWAHYSQLHRELVTWGPEWGFLLGEETPAGVHFASKQIALRPLDYDPTTLQFFLFHELAHLADPHVVDGRANRFEAEVFAWTETRHWIEFVRGRGIEIPLRFQLIYRGLTLRGEADWVANVLETASRRR